jgi:hypothetical protein
VSGVQLLFALAMMVEAQSCEEPKPMVVIALQDVLHPAACRRLGILVGCRRLGCRRLSD